MNDVVIVAAKRTPIGNFLGGLSSLPAHLLGKAVIESVLSETSVNVEDIAEVILGQVLTAGCGQNPARQASLAASLPKEVSAWGVNHVCGSGLKSVMLGAQSIMSGNGQVVIAGGQESMSNSPHVMNIRNGVKMGNGQMVDSMVCDGLWEAMEQYHMGVTAENIANKYKISRDTQDEFALQSQQKAASAASAGYFDEEIIPVIVPHRKGDITIANDEFIKPETTPAILTKLRPAFDKAGSVTAGNSSGINDGAAALVLTSAEYAKEKGLQPLARIASYGQSGVAPDVMGIGPVGASLMALQRAGWTHEDLDLIEANEAFAVQATAVNQEMGWDVQKVNVSGGAIALGHPIGASGARILVTLLHGMKRLQANKGLATLCIGGGMGVALCVERV